MYLKMQVDAYGARLPVALHCDDKTLSFCVVSGIALDEFPVIDRNFVAVPQSKLCILPVSFPASWEPSSIISGMSRDSRKKGASGCNWRKGQEYWLSMTSR